MNQSRIASLCGVLVFLLSVITDGADVKPTTLPAVEPIAQLAPGKTPGTVHLVYKAKAEFTIAGHCPLVVSALANYRDQAATLAINDAKEFTFEADLRPGTYTLMVSPADLEHAGYCPSESQSIHIDKAGRLYQPHPWLGYTPRDFVLVKRLKELSPKDGQIAAEQSPLLTWPKVEGSTHFRGYYMNDLGMKWFNVDELQYRIGGGVAAGEACGWRVEALTDDGKIIARGEGVFFGHGTDEATVAKWRSEVGTCSIGVSPGPGYLGIHALPTQVPKDPATPIPDMGTSGRVVQDASSGFIPGLSVMEVVPGSPGIDADLHPDDVIIAVDGKAIAVESNMGDFRRFVQQIAAMSPGTQTTFTVRRFPQELKLTATIGSVPGATTRPTTTPATEPAKEVVADNGAALKTEVVWRDVEPGSPTITPFTAAPGADIVNLGTNEGLAADNVEAIAELPNDGMAFGTQLGLSIWNGKEIRTYTGPHNPVGADRALGRIKGNSGLPDNMVDRLLTDSRGRLWVATTIGGICRIDNAPDGRWHVLDNPQRGFGSNREPDWTLNVRKIFETSDGTIVLGGGCAGITLIDPKTDAPRLVHRDDDVNHMITGIAEDKQHRLWFSVMGVGVLRYDGAKIEQLPATEKWITSTQLMGLCIDGAGTIWTGGKGLGALHADGTAETIGGDQLPGAEIFDLSSDRFGRVWVTTDGGIAVREPNDANGAAKPWKYLSVIETPTGFESVLQTSDGSIWINRPVKRYAKWSLTAVNPAVEAVDRYKREIEKTYPKVQVDPRTAIGVGKIVVGAPGKKLLRFDGKVWEDLTEKLGPLDVAEIHADSKGTVWVATSGQGLIGINAAGIRRDNNDPNDGKCVIYCLAEAPDSTMYAGTQHGLYRFGGEKWDKLETDQPAYQLTSVVVDRRGRVWAFDAIFSGVFVFDGKRFHEMKSQTKLADEPIEGLTMDAAGNVVVIVPARPGEKRPQRTYRWDATAEKIGPPVEVIRYRRSKEDFAAPRHPISSGNIEDSGLRCSGSLGELRN